MEQCYALTYHFVQTIPVNLGKILIGIHIDAITIANSNTVISIVDNRLELSYLLLGFDQCVLSLLSFRNIITVDIYIV